MKDKRFEIAKNKSKPLLKEMKNQRNDINVE